MSDAQIMVGCEVVRLLHDFGLLKTPELDAAGEVWHLDMLDIYCS